MNKLGRQSAYHVGEHSEIAAARRACSELARQLGFDETRAGQVALVTTEAATNIVKHAQEGEILIRSVHSNGVAGIEVLAIDKGPGMDNVALRMEDGHSTAGTYGVGLGAIGRMAQEFDLYSSPGMGTVLMIVVWADGVERPRPHWLVGAVCLPIGGETVSGDAWSTAEGPGGSLVIAAADGLGHGPQAAEASETAVELIASVSDAGPAELMQIAHGSLRSSRGAALAVAQVEPLDGTLCFAGVGNIAGSVFQPGGRRHLMSHNGIVGSNLRKVQEFVHPWDEQSLLIMHSDGVATRWDIAAYPGLAVSHPALVAAVIYRDYARGRDDVLVLAVREGC